jgi:phage protein D
MSLCLAPRARVLADGAALPGVMQAEVISTNHYAADSYSVQLALTADPAGLAGWDDRTASLIEVQIGLGPQGDWTSLVTGHIDSLEADPVAGIATIYGRDLTALFIEARTREAFANQTASDIATLLAGRQGLSAAVTQTTTPIGRYYSDGHERLTLDRFARASTQWDLLVWLAQQEGFDVFVQGSTLHFQPEASGATPALVLQATALAGVPANIATLHLHREMTLARPLSVTVNSWNSQQQTTFSQMASRSGNGTPRAYVYARPNLTPNAAWSLAQNKLAALTRHAYVLTATMPGELNLAPRDTVSLVGTDSSFDQSYVVDEIVRRIDVRHGFTQTVRACTPGTAMAGA